MSCTILLAISDRQCAQAALNALTELTNYTTRSDDELVVLGIVQPFRTIYAHKHPLIGRPIRDLLWQVNGAQVDEVERVVRETSADFESLGWRVRQDIREGDIAVEISRCCREICPKLLVIGWCLRNSLSLWSSGEIWQRVVSEAVCSVLVVKHGECTGPLHSADGQVVEKAADLNHVQRQRVESHVIVGA